MTWICCNRPLNNNELLEKDGSVSVYHQNVRQLAIEMFKVFSRFQKFSE